MRKAMSKNSGFDFDGEWIWVVLMLAVFWPVGLVLLWRKLKQFKRGRNEAAQMNRSGGSLLAIGAVTLLLLRKFVWGFPVAAVGGLLLFFGNQSRQREKRYKRYLALIGGRASVSIRELAAAVHVPVSQAVRELEQMIELGYFGMTTYVDQRSMRIVLDASAAQEQASQQPIYVEPEPEPEPTPQPAPEKKEEKRATNSTDGDDQFGRWISAIREVNDRIDDAVISAKIDRIEVLTVRIFELVRSRPDKQPQIRKFMNYYLPTTLKLLDSYALLEAQGIEGENISASKKQIESIMDTLIQGFEKQLDLLFTAQKMDINSDIEVLESMMAADGLKENEFQLPRSSH